MSMNGSRLFRSALLFESAANIGSVIQMFLAPGTFLSMLLKNPSADITPVTKSMTQWMGAIVLALTLPLALSYPHPSPGDKGKDQIAFRRLTYMTLGAGEITLGTTFAWQFLTGESGMSDTALVAAMGIMGVFAGMRGFFLYVRPGFLEAQGNARKAM